MSPSDWLHGCRGRLIETSDRKSDSHMCQPSQLHAININQLRVPQSMDTSNRIDGLILQRKLPSTNIHSEHTLSNNRESPEELQLTEHKKETFLYTVYTRLYACQWCHLYTIDTVLCMIHWWRSAIASFFTACKNYWEKLSILLEHKSIIIS